MVYQAEDPPCVIGVAAMDSSHAGEGGEGFAQAGFLFPGQEVAGRNNQ
jgi:hypothetical protein